MFVKQELSDIVLEDKHHWFKTMEDMADCSSDDKMTGYSDVKSTRTENDKEALLKVETYQRMSENISSV